ncbi:hypothetical protein XAUC_03300 [Xanthomonas citri pv. aurantifolii str. ICPB 10535]|nr:hypothetical protein XAUC_03300 [Xanthomonas citri pv. aurantifolii str. ICPB 10535]
MPLDQDRHAIAAAHHHVADVLQRMQQADAADHVALFATVHHAAAAIGVVAGDGALDLLQRHPVPGQAVRLQRQRKLRGEAAEVGHIGHAWHLLQARNHRPELQVGQLAQAACFRFQRVAINLAGG